MTTQLEMVTKIRRKTYEATAARYSDAMMRDWLNDACDDAARRTQCLRTTDTIAVVSGTNQYNAPADLLSLHAISLRNTGGYRDIELDYADYKNVASAGWGGLNDTEGTPALFWTWGFPPTMQITLYPTPSETGTLTLRYYQTFTKLAVDTAADDATQLPFPPGWDDMLVNFAVSEALLSDRDQRYEEYRARYESALTGFADTSVRFSDQAGQITPQGGMVPSWLYEFDY